MYYVKMMEKDACMVNMIVNMVFLTTAFVALFFKNRKRTKIQLNKEITENMVYSADDSEK